MDYKHHKYTFMLFLIPTHRNNYIQFIKILGHFEKHFV